MGWWFLTKLNIVLSYNPAVTFTDIYSDELKIMSTQKPVQRYLRFLMCVFETDYVFTCLRL